MSEPADSTSARDGDDVLVRLEAYFMGKSKVHAAAVSLAQRLDDLGIDYAVAGALALAAHGFVRATEDVDVLISREALARFKADWLGRGYVDVRPGAKAVRDTVNGVRIDFLIAGDYPGDGHPKPVSFPDPALLPDVDGRLRVLPLARLVELKLASAMTAAHRGHDFFDIVALARGGHVTEALRPELDSYVHEKFDEALRLADAARDDDY